MELEIRTARPDDRGPIAELMYSSGTDIYDFLYRERAVPFLRHEFASGEGFGGHPNVTVALLDDEVVGTGCFYGRDTYDALVRGTVKNTFAFFGAFGAPGVLLRSRHAGSVMHPPREDELYLSNFGVLPSLRSRGIGARMIAHALEGARRRGYRVFGLDVSAANPRAEALYARLGLEVKEEKTFSAKGAGVHAARKMELAL